MRFSFHSARRCACGTGCHIGTSDPLEAFVRLVATREPARVVEVDRVEDLDAMEVVGAQLAPVRCHACGAIGTPTHVVIAEGGRPVGADTIATMLTHGAREDERTRNLRAALPPLESYAVPDSLGPEDLKEEIR